MKLGKYTNIIDNSKVIVYGYSDNLVFLINPDNQRKCKLIKCVFFEYHSFNSDDNNVQ